MAQLYVFVIVLLLQLRYCFCIPPLDRVALQKSDITRFNKNLRTFIIPKPTAISIRGYMSPVRDQGDRGTCTAFAAMGMLEAFVVGRRWSEQCLAFDNPGPLINNTDPSRIYNRLMYALSNRIYSEAYCPYSSNRDDVPTPRNVLRSVNNAIINTKQNAMICEKEQSLDLVQQIIAFVKNGCSVGIEFFVIGKWWSKYDDLSAISTPNEDELCDFYKECLDDQNYKCNDNRWQSGTNCPSHAVVVSGYDDVTQTIEIKNQWGTYWKDKGYGKLTYDYLAHYILDRTMGYRDVTPHAKINGMAASLFNIIFKK